MNKQQYGWWSGLILAIAITPVGWAQSANFDTLTLDATKSSGVLSGVTGGSTSLPAIVSNADSNGSKCLGFADPNPDHRLVLKQDFPRIRLKVDSGGDTTLVIKGPNGLIACGDDTGSNRDASLTGVNWPAGTYSIWVGSATPKTRRDYTLSVRP